MVQCWHLYARDQRAPPSVWNACERAVCVMVRQQAITTAAAAAPSTTSGSIVRSIVKTCCSQLHIQGMEWSREAGEVSRLLLLLAEAGAGVGLEEDDVAVVDHVLLALLLEETGGLDGGLVAVLLEVREGHDLGAHETVAEVGVDHASRIRSKRSFLQTRSGRWRLSKTRSDRDRRARGERKRSATYANGPAAHFLGASRKEVNQLQRVVAGGDDLGNGRRHSDLSQEGLLGFSIHVEQLHVIQQRLMVSAPARL